ncbi:MAG: methyltransferase [Gammaproteobacteria bacterium]|nr:methyltransferase [Gammaproteobacteria bacterium]MDH5304677.1 methyltransferase [Gammaproteobacteria bacterium]MDH5323176.1 methyltransferase [Gammaproteobacteria bacterium]
MDARTAAALDAAISGDHRSNENRARDQFRRPRETLAFFGFRSDATVVEFSPGGGWYTEILAPALRDSGKLYAPHYDVNAGDYERGSLGAFLQKLGASPQLYDRVVVTAISDSNGEPIAPPGSADLVLTFRNVHNWLGAGGESGAIARFTEMFQALKPGGVLGVVAHRWPEAATEDPAAGNGYVSEDRVIALAAAAGFEFVARSEHNYNPKDTHDHPNGVWSLPPGLEVDDTDKERYREIGESDRMTLKFRKPDAAR